MGFTLPVGLFASQAGGGDAGDVLTGLIAAWTFESDFADQVGANDLTNNGSMAIALGIVGNAAEFDGASYLSRASTADLQMGAIDFTISLILRLGGAPVFTALIGKWENISDPEYLISLEDSGSLEFKIQAPSGLLTSTFLMVPDTPYLIIAKHQASDGGMSLRVVELGGAVDDQNSRNGVIINAAANGALRIGFDDFTALPEGTVIDAVHIWKRYLSAADEELLINGGLGDEYPFS